jgi:hypothetical protein
MGPTAYEVRQRRTGIAAKRTSEQLLWVDHTLNNAAAGQDFRPLD